MVVDSNILEKLRQASQQYNHKKKQLSSRVDTWYNLTQSDSQTLPSTQACPTIYSSQPNRGRVPQSQWDFPQSDIKLSQITSSTRPSSNLLSFDAYCQSEPFDLLNGVSIGVGTVALTNTLFLTTESNISNTHIAPRVSHSAHAQTDKQEAEITSLITGVNERIDSGFRNILSTIQGLTLPNKTTKTECDDDELLYLSFLFEHDASVTEFLDAPVLDKEISVIATVATGARKRARKTPLLAVKDEDVVARPVVGPFSCSLKRARVTC